MANMNTCSKSVVTRKIQIKTIMKYNQILIRMTKIQVLIIPNASEDVEKQKFIKFYWEHKIL